jgi:hypothetical protein
MNVHKIARDTMEQIHAYRDGAKPPRAFLMYVLAGDLYEAAECCNTLDRRAFFDIIDYIKMELPEGSYGSPENYHLWITAGVILQARLKKSEEIR